MEREGKVNCYSRELSEAIMRVRASFPQSARSDRGMEQRWSTSAFEINCRWWGILFRGRSEDTTYRDMALHKSLGINPRTLSPQLDKKNLASFSPALDVAWSFILKPPTTHPHTHTHIHHPPCPASKNSTPSRAKQPS